MSGALGIDGRRRSLGAWPGLTVDAAGWRAAIEGLAASQRDGREAGRSIRQPARDGP